LLLMLAVILINYGGALWVSIGKPKQKYKLWIVVVANLLILFYFKYFNFFIHIIEGITRHDINIFEVLLPIGISFYIFQALSYFFDVYGKKCKVQRNPLKLALYISLFPQLIAGPIVKYSDIETQINYRVHTSKQFYYGVRRFIYGLSKKVIIANTLGMVADKIFENHPAQLGMGVAWLGIICYALQIYFDFSGYSCMAIGLGAMFGFTFRENFNHPYISTSVQDFWRRWHISLSSWFKEYVYIPLGGNRKGKARTYLNLLIIFTLTGIWHGANWTFLVWGLFYGFFLVIERMFLGNALKRNPQKIFNWLYTMLVVLIAWVFFRSPDMGYAMKYLGAMFGFYGANGIQPAIYYLTMNAILIFPFAVLFCGILQNWLRKPIEKFKTATWVFWVESACLFVMLCTCILLLANNTYNPFIYFQF